RIMTKTAVRLEEWLLDLSLYEVLWYFVIYSFLGWCMEVVFCTVTTGKLVNRGFLNGPVCPIYGFGMVIVLLVLGRFAENIWLLFFGGMILTSALELVGGWALKKFFHTTWWDYSDQPFNIGGYICLKFSLAWGFCVVAAVRVLHTAVETFVHWLPFVLGVILLCILMAYFLTDTIVTVLTIRKLNRSLSIINDMAARLRRNSDVLSDGLGRLALKADEKFTEQKLEFDEKTAAGRAVLEEKLQEQRDQLAEKQEERRAVLEERRTQMQHAAEELRTEWVSRTSKLQRWVQRRLLRAFPGMRNERDNDALHRVRAWLEEKKKR
ncbi:MAG: hypothetical protein ACI4GO_00175, partial [Hominenteromicrobium sp.]